MSAETSDLCRRVAAMASEQRTAKSVLWQRIKAASPGIQDLVSAFDAKIILCDLDGERVIDTQEARNVEQCMQRNAERYTRNMAVERIR